jgi:hypothetical protein
MASVLTEGSTVLCGPAAPPPPAPATSHGGKVTTVSTAKLQVNGKRVLVASSLTTITGCATTVSPTSAPCSALVAPPPPPATKLLAGGSPVLLDTIAGAGKTNGNPFGTLAATANQTKLTAI